MGRLEPAGNGQACPAKSDCHCCSGGRHRLDTDRRRAATLPGAVPGPPSTRDTWQRLGTFPMSQPVGNTTGLWRAEARGAATCPAARATQCQEPALKAQPCRVTPLVESQKSQSSKAEQIGSGGNGGGARAARPRGGTGLRALHVRAGRCGQLAIRPSRWDMQASSLHWRPGDSGARSSLSAP